MDQPVLLLVLVCVPLITPAHSNGIIHYSSHIHHAVKTRFAEILDFPPSNKITANYYLSYETRNCCPTLAYDIIYEGKQVDLGYQNDCLPFDPREEALYNSYKVITQADLNPECRYEGTRTVCNGTRTLTYIKPVKWYIYFVYESIFISSLKLCAHTIQYTHWINK